MFDYTSIMDAGSATLPDELADLVAQAEAGVAAIVDVPLADVPAPALLRGLARLEVLRRRLDAAATQVLGEVERTGAFAVDGHTSTAAALRYLSRCSGATAARRVRMARELGRLPQLAAAFERGEVSADHVDVVCRVTRNPRVAPFVTAETDAWFTGHATDPDLAFASFERLVKVWEELADADGAADRTARIHAARGASCHQGVDGSFRLEASLGSLDGAVVSSVLESEERRLFDLDWAAARELHGDETRLEHLARTPRQRRADALVAIFRRASSIDLGDVHRVQPEPLVNVIVDQETFERAVRRAAGDDVEADDPQRADEVRCHTADGHHIHPDEVVVAAVVGHVRRVVLDGAGTVIDLGRRRRLFTGAARDAALLGGWAGLSPGCGWAGCGISPHRCQIDHVLEWRRGGTTDQANARALCGHHNRLRSAGFELRTDDDGRPVHLRPDGQRITTPV